MKTILIIVAAVELFLGWKCFYAGTPESRFDYIFLMTIVMLISGAIMLFSDDQYKNK